MVRKVVNFQFSFFLFIFSCSSQPNLYFFLSVCGKKKHFVDQNIFLNIYFLNFYLVETINNGVLMSPPHNNSSLTQRESMLITQPSSIPSSPLASPGALSSTSFCLQSTSNNNTHSFMDTTDVTADPNWQATKPTVRERNAAMFNNDLMADIKFVVGCDGEKIII